jgi:glycosyltransferase involved in cell wall biosynthesis
VTRITLLREALEDRELCNYLPLEASEFTINVVTSRQSGVYSGTGMGFPTTRLWRHNDFIRPKAIERRSRALLARLCDPEGLFALERGLAEADVVCVNETFLASSAQACRLQQGRDRPRIVTLCYENIPFQYEGDPLVARRKEDVRRATDVFIAATPAAKSALVAEGVEPRRIVVQPSGVDTNRFSPACRNEKLRASWGVRSDDVVFLYAGRLLREKGLLNLLLAVERCGSLRGRLILVGSGAEEARLRRAVAARRLEDRVSFLSWIDYEKMPAVMASADVFVMPSLPTPYNEEQLGFSLIEAMASEVPVLATIGASVPWVVGDGGLVVPPYDVEALSEGLEQLTADGRLRSSLGAAGRKRAETLLNVECFAATFAEVVRGIAR